MKYLLSPMLIGVLIVFSYPVMATNFKKVTIKSAAIEQTVRFDVALPESYQQHQGRRYPIFLTTAGQSRLDSVRAQVQWLSHVSFAPIPEVILVTMPSISLDDDNKQVSGEGGLDKLRTQILETDIIPFLDKNYRTSGYRIIEGFSTLGNLGLYVLRNNSELFDAYFLFSPALAMNTSGLVSSFDNWSISGNSKPFVFLSLGTFAENKPHFEALSVVLANMAQKGHLQFQSADYSQDNYLAGPNMGLIKASQAAFSDLSPDYIQFHQSGVSALRKYFEGIQNKYGFNIDMDSKMVDLAFSYVSADKADAGIKVMEEAISSNPQSTLLTLRKAQIEMGAARNNQAKDTLKKALSLAQSQNNAEAISYIKGLMSRING